MFRIKIIYNILYGRNINNNNNKARVSRIYQYIKPNKPPTKLAARPVQVGSCDRKSTPVGSRVYYYLCSTLGVTGRLFMNAHVCPTFFFINIKMSSYYFFLNRRVKTNIEFFFFHLFPINKLVNLRFLLDSRQGRAVIFESGTGPQTFSIAYDINIRIRPNNNDRTFFNPNKTM